MFVKLAVSEETRLGADRFLVGLLVAPCRGLLLVLKSSIYI